MRSGIGYDVHRFAKGRPLIIGGVEIPFEMGLLGHSDADVLVHAIMDALLGAAAFKDIGYHFPDSDEEYEGASSIVLLGRVSQMLMNEGYEINNVDATVICERPRLRPYIDEMVENIADALGVDIDRVNVKATTEEGLGFTGEMLGISALATCALSEGEEQA